MPKLPTVEIIYGDGFLRINKSDYDPDKHQLYKSKIPESKPPDTRLNINTADINELKKLPTVGVAIARKIIELRPFSSREDLEAVEGLSVDAIADLITF